MPSAEIGRPAGQSADGDVYPPKYAPIAMYFTGHDDGPSAIRPPAGKGRRVKKIENVMGDFSGKKGPE